MNISRFLRFVKDTRPIEEFETVRNALDQYSVSMATKAPVLYDVLIYRVFCKDPSITDCYVGHTTKSIKSRMYHHEKTCCNSGYLHHNKKLYKFMRLNGGFENFTYEILDGFKSDMISARKAEQYWIDFHNPTLNKIDSYGVGPHTPTQGVAPSESVDS
jgi:hypothetical protein